MSEKFAKQFKPIKIDMHGVRLPEFEVEENKTNVDNLSFLKSLCFEGYEKKLLSKDVDASEAEKYLKELGLEKIKVGEQPLEVETGSGKEFLEHPLLRGGFLDDIYECFQNQDLANNFMDEVFWNDRGNEMTMVRYRKRN